MEGQGRGEQVGLPSTFEHGWAQGRGLQTVFSSPLQYPQGTPRAGDQKIGLGARAWVPLKGRSVLDSPVGNVRGRCANRPRSMVNRRTVDCCWRLCQGVV